MAIFVPAETDIDCTWWWVLLSINLKPLILLVLGHDDDLMCVIPLLDQIFLCSYSLVLLEPLLELSVIIELLLEVGLAHPLILDPDAFLDGFADEHLNI